MNTDVNAFLSAVREQMNYRQEQVLTSSGDYNEDEKLNRQVVDPGIDLKVHPSHIRMELPEPSTRGTRGIGMSHHQHAACKNPRRFALWQGLTTCRICVSPTSAYPALYADLDDGEEQTKSQSEAFRKDTDLSKKPTQLTPHCSPAPKKPQEWRRT
jgi:conjugal transfer ATP-binding protein TraC